MLDTAKAAEIIRAIAVRMEAEKDFLTQLDNEIGDGDHGINLERGFKAVLEKLPEVENGDIGGLFKGVGMQLVSHVGGASGPLYGTAFMKAGNILKGKTEASAADFAAAMEAAIGGIKMRGKSEPGEKTMLDALCPAYKALSEAIDGGAELKEALEKAVAAAKEGVEYTKTIIATKGRASYLGERSIGHQDPGATSSLYMLEEMVKCL
ncbi:dihydroxyacetone kinase subunit DhaL [Selenomonas ruminantium]|uniref:phosphoenolpyruvate--glycerone phosphotransferase n=1 Tax=Selenomonas ruminantium TaxID=971 RepID=A0A1H0MFK0_SELRU|nr:dihydroxyacetone kinase subunit DhaL [Selenomonas ruminantium]SDO79252.1 dihydroxyacetone kinase DhaL subunit [Selenomonas ruminantium]